MAGAIQDGVVGISEVHVRCYRLSASSRWLFGLVFGVNGFSGRVPVDAAGAFLRFPTFGTLKGRIWIPISGMTDPWRLELEWVPGRKLELPPSEWGPEHGNPSGAKEWLGLEHWELNGRLIARTVSWEDFVPFPMALY